VLREASPAFIDVAQPRWVGPKYWETAPRTVVLTINPGRSPKNSTVAPEFLSQIRQFREGTLPLQAILNGQRERMEFWGHGRFKRFYIDGLGLDFDNIAFANVAWCATADNSYPRSMLLRCFAKHTGPLLKVLRPDVVLCSGGPTHPFARLIAEWA
jgi:hypothetical protein